MALTVRRTGHEAWVPQTGPLEVGCHIKQRLQAIFLSIHNLPPGSHHRKVMDKRGVSIL